MERYEVFPKAGGWCWRFGSQQSKKFDTRAEALADVFKHRGDERLYDAEGNSPGALRGPDAVVLLREDGSVYGEIDHEVRHGGPPQYVTLKPAGESSKAVKLGG
jgi:hypothetical protein